MTRPPATPEVTGPGETEPDGATPADRGAADTSRDRVGQVSPERDEGRRVAGEHERGRRGRGNVAASHAAPPSAPKHRAESSADIRFERVLEELRSRVRAIEFSEGLPGANEGMTARNDVLSQLDDYVLPRVRRPDVPLLIAVAGSTGAGKSTLVNSLVGEQVTTTGVRRPTTNSPVLACNPTDVGWFSEASFLPTLPRVRQQGLAMPGKDGMLVLAASECMPEGVALLDTPDVDSAVAAHHEFAAKFLDAADLWMFVTTSTRYADARVWDFLRVARDRNTSLAVVLSRVPRRGRAQLLDHFGAMLEANGLGNATRFAISETDQISGERFTSNVADDVRSYLAEVAGDLAQRDLVSRRTFIGVVDSFLTRVPELTRQVETQVEIGRNLELAVENAYSTALQRAAEAIGDGSLLGGNLLARWREIAASGELVRAMRPRKKRRNQAAEEESAARVRALEQAIRDTLEALVVSSAERAAEEVVANWGEIPGADALAERAGGSQVPEDLGRRAREAVIEWQASVQEMISADGATKRSVARVVTIDKEAIALVMIIELLGYASTAATENRSVPPPQRLLKGLFGSESLRSIGRRARDDLYSRITEVLQAERARFDDALANAKLPGEGDAVQLYHATYNLEIAR
ncbi:GTPase [Halostreptopolyspora alba]|uniref:ABC transporter n=1 Tax=Halostreptopolyspora alba TaxID=2487137 RepID=A0A3N0EHG4_9ACTN|nr:ABC transporter [Nocardiopsaceae bacterium YIM 96095]